MKRPLALIVVVMLFALLFSCAKKAEQMSASGYVAKVGSVTITQDDVTRELKGLPPQIQSMFVGPEGMDRFVDELVKKEILYQEAKKKGLENDPEYKKKIEDFKKISLISLLLEKEVEGKVKVTDDDVKKFYEANKNKLVTKEGKALDFNMMKDLLTQRVTAEKQKELFDSYLEGLKKSYPVEKNKDAIAKLASLEQSQTPTGTAEQAAPAVPAHGAK